MKARRIELQFGKDVKISMLEVISFVEKEAAKTPNREYFMDGDLYAIVSQERD